MPPRGQPSKFAPLNRYLAQLPADQATVRLTFAEIEALIGAPLSLTARTTQDAWTLHPVARHNWLPHGFRASLERRAGAVTFTRTPWP